jgi:hypothetical protein
MKIEELENELQRLLEEGIEIAQDLNTNKRTN